MHNQYFRLPLQFIFARLSLVKKITPLPKYHKNIFILSGSLSFHHLVGEKWVCTWSGQ
uniref:Uncharacterized protein n=1 Tax=Arundo donax TaxID=35708 RepID=A0A0A8YIJ3_ARUDO